MTFYVTPPGVLILSDPWGRSEIVSLEPTPLFSPDISPEIPQAPRRA